MAPRPSIKNEDKYQALRDEGYNKETAARIANSPGAGNRGGKAGHYETWTKDDLYERAQELDIEGRSGMSKDELIEALRHNRRDGSD